VTTSSPRGSSRRAYAVAVASIAVAVLSRVALTPVMGPVFPLATTFSAVAFVVWYGGWAPALFTAIGGFLVTDALMTPGNSLTRPPVAEVILYRRLPRIVRFNHRPRRNDPNGAAAS